MNINPIRYRGYYYDIDTGFYYLQSRYYDPVTGRFLNADTLFDSGAGLLGYNLFAYCANNPVMRFDPTGEGFWDTLKAVGEKLVKGAAVALAVVGTVAAVAGTAALIVGTGGGAAVALGAAAAVISAAEPGVVVAALQRLPSEK